MLVPEQSTPQSPITWKATRLQGSEPLALRASKRMRSDETLIVSLGATILRKHLDAIPLWRGDHVAIRPVNAPDLVAALLRRLGERVHARPPHEEADALVVATGSRLPAPWTAPS